MVAAGLLLVLRPTQAPAGQTVPDFGTTSTAVGTTEQSVPTSGPELRTDNSGGSTGRTDEAGESADPTPSTAPPTGPGSVAPPPTAPVLPSIPVAPSVPATVVPPVTVTVPSWGVTATVVPVGIDQAGLMEVPADVGTVGWYRFGPTPGDPVGSAVLTGHVDAADQGRGVFADLGLLGPGDVVEVSDADGIVHRFQVTARESWRKEEVPLDRLFDRTGPGRLVLITCGGAFDPDALSYEENIAVTAVPVP